MHALVTGGGGFLGRYIVEQLLERGDRVRVFSRGDYPDLRAIGVEVVQGDIRDACAVADACRGIDCVFHVAAMAGVGVFPKKFYEINEAGTRHVVAGCVRNHVGRLVLTSSPSVVFAGEDQCGIDPSHPANLEWLIANRCHYSASKLLAEREVLLGTAGQASSAEALATCALRPHLIWGPRDNHLIPRLIDRARRGRLRRIGAGTNLVDITYVENAATAHLQAADALADANSPVCGKAYFLSQGEPVNCWQWIDQVLALAKLPPVEKSISLRSAHRIGHLCESAYRLFRIEKEPPMTRFLARQLATSHWFDISAAREDFGYEPKISTEAGMKRLGEWLVLTTRSC